MTQKASTLCVQAGWKPTNGEPRILPIYQSTTFKYDTTEQMADLFLTTRNNVTLHIGNIFKEGELVETSVRKDSLLTASDGKKI